MHADHLGSTRLVTGFTNPSSPVDNLDYLPFGEQIAGGSSITQKFTGYDRAAESGLDYASARHFSSTLGRFMSPDSLSGSPGNPQSWNRYSYVYNNPINATDPSGMCSEEDGYTGCDWGDGWGTPDVYGWFWYWAPDYSSVDTTGYEGWLNYSYGNTRQKQFPAANRNPAASRNQINLTPRVLR